MARYLVTGAAGFIGSKVAELLLGQGHEVVGVDNINDAYDVRMKHWRLQQFKSLPRFRFEQLDISQWPAVEKAWQSSGPFDAVLNLAARAGMPASLENPWVYIDTNITGTLNLLECCRRSGVKKFVQASTSGLYGAHNPMPYREDADTSRPLAPYPASKKGAEVLCHSYHHIYGLDITILRFFTVYGPAGRPDLVLFRLVQRINEGTPITIFGDGTQKRDFTYLDDIACGTIAALRLVGYEIINLGADKPVELNTCIRMIEEMLGKKGNYVHRSPHPADIYATWADISKARQMLDWSPTTHVEEGLRRMVDWYAENREWARQVKTD
jgi:nucleoside-diphosphate-sugar epimerase